MSSQNAGSLGTGIGAVFTNIFPKVLGTNDLSVTITALEQTGESQTLSAPRLTVLKNVLGGAVAMGVTYGVGSVIGATGV